MRSIELLAPAKTADIGIEAIKHGADAVYIGAQSFGARASAGNSIEDISRLTAYAHLYKARVYVTVNTIIYEEETESVLSLIQQLHDIDVDAIIIQDLRLLSLPLPPIPLHASTQMDNRTPEKVKQLASLGFPQVVLARELTPDEIADIHHACPDTTLEVFVHGALCVSLSGRCNASEALFHRSANRGECAQVCRMAFDLTATTSPSPESPAGYLARDRQLLSQRDNCQIDTLKTLLEAGATSFKIEGRLKDADYVKNITAAYSQALNSIIANHPDLSCRASSGHSTLSFTPDVMKSFNRSFVRDTSRPDANFDTPKSLGEPVHRNTQLHNGDGLCYIKKGKLFGFRLNNAATFRPSQSIQYYRNQDEQWDKMMSRPSAQRRIWADFDLHEDHISMTDEDGCCVSITFPAPLSETHELARTHQGDNMRRQLSRLGETIFEARSINIHLRKNNFIPSSTLSAWRQQLTQLLTQERTGYYPLQRTAHTPVTISTEQPFELTHDMSQPLMTCRHCIRRQMGMCLKDSSPRTHKTYYNLKLHTASGTTFRLDFDCVNCLMKIYIE